LRAQRTRGQSCLHKDLSRLHETTTEKTDLSEFMELLRSGAPIPNQMIYDFAKLFRDEFLLDNLPRSQLVAMCKFLHIDGPYMKGQAGEIHLRFLLRRRMTSIKNDDKDIHWEGVETLSKEELLEAAWLRGIPTEVRIV
jgi:LETM1 and EF-hand domain-containing protein 1